MNKITINPSLARGLRKQNVKALYTELNDFSNRAGAELTRGCQRTVPVFKRMVKAIRAGHKEQIYFDTLKMDKKRSHYRAIMWLPRTDGKLNIVWVVVEARNIGDIQYFHMVDVTKHAIERMMERMKTDSLTVIMQELEPVALRLVKMDKEEDWPDFMEVETAHGKARLLREDLHYNLVTYIKVFK